MKIYPYFGAKPSETVLEWDFPSGAKVKFASMQHESDRQDWQGAQMALIAFDELTHFSWAQVSYMFSRNRTMAGIKPYIRATCNPDPDSWVTEFVNWWIDQDSGYPINDRIGVVRYFSVVGNEVVWADDAQTLVERFPAMYAPLTLPTGEVIPQQQPMSVTFIPARLTDNRKLMLVNPSYRISLLALPLVERAQLLDGNWKVRASAGKVFHRDWFEIVDEAPAGGDECRYWDWAATERKVLGSKPPARKERDPDYTAGVKIRRVRGVYYIMDAIWGQWGPDKADDVFLATTHSDVRLAARSRTRYCVDWEHEPGAAGIKENLRVRRLIPGIRRYGKRSSGDKLLRSRALAIEAEARMVKVVRGPWNEAWLAHMHGIPDGPHDDIHDASAGAFNRLRGGRPVTAASGQRRLLAAPFVVR